MLFAGTPDQWRYALARFAERGLTQTVVQAHVPGDLVKFYGVLGYPGENDWFQWFYHADQQLSRHSFPAQSLKVAVFNAAAALGLEIFGGDAIIDAAGEAWIIDLNAWPSFARCRDGATQAIAGRLAYRFDPSRAKPPYLHPLTKERA